jgi:hypothetical protein
MPEISVGNNRKIQQLCDILRNPPRLNPCEPESNASEISHCNEIKAFAAISTGARGIVASLRLPRWVHTKVWPRTEFRQLRDIHGRSKHQKF